MLVLPSIPAGEFRVLRFPAVSGEVPYGVLEDRQAIAWFLSFTARPPWMMGPLDVPFRMWHQAEHASRFIANPGHIGHRSVGVDGEWKRIITKIGFLTAVPQCQLPLLFQAREHIGLADNELSFGVCDGQIHSLNTLQKHTSPVFAHEIVFGHQIDPPIFKSSRIVPRERDGSPVFLVIAEQNSGLDEHLKSVADSQHQFLGDPEFVDRVAQMMSNLVGQRCVLPRCRHHS